MRINLYLLCVMFDMITDIDLTKVLVIRFK